MAESVWPLLLSRRCQVRGHSRLMSVHAQGVAAAELSKRVVER